MWGEVLHATRAVLVWAAGLLLLRLTPHDHVQDFLIHRHKHTHAHTPSSAYNTSLVLQHVAQKITNAYSPYV